MKVNMQIREDIAQNPFIWPGGYERFAVTDDGGVICHHCCVNEREVLDSSVYGDGWNIVADSYAEAYEEFLCCDHCGHVISQRLED